MQEHAFEPLFLQASVQVEVAIFVVARNRVPLAGQVHADLVRAPGLDGHLQQAHGRQPQQGLGRQRAANAHQRDGAHAVRIIGRGHPHAAFAVGLQVFVQRQINHLVVGRPGALDQGQVGLAGLALAELVLQMRQRRALLGHQQDTGCLAVEPMHKFQKTALRPRLAQLLDDAKTHTRATMHGHTGRLVDGDQVLVFQQAGEIPGWRRPIGLFGDFFGNAHGRDADDIAGRNAGFRTDAPFVDAHLSTADDAIDMGLGNALEMAYEKVVQPLSGRIVIDFDQPHCGSGCVQRTVVCRFALYNVFHLCRTIYKWLILMEFSPNNHFPAQAGRCHPVSCTRNSRKRWPAKFVVASVVADELKH